MLATISPYTRMKSLLMTDLSWISLKASPIDTQLSDRTGVIVQLEHSLHFDCLKNIQSIVSTCRLMDIQTSIMQYTVQKIRTGLNQLVSLSEQGLATCNCPSLTLRIVIICMKGLSTHINFSYTNTDNYKGKKIKLKSVNLKRK